MATFTWQSAVSGSWATDSLWAGGAAPNDAAAAVALSAVGTYTVTVPSDSKFGVASVNGAAGVTLSVAGTLSIANALTVGTTVIEAGGEIRAATANAFLQVQKGTVTNTGTLSAAGTGTYLFLNNTTLTNLSGGVLTGGTYSASGQAAGGSVATIDFARSGISTEITTLDATVILRFVNSGLQGRNAAGTVRGLESTLATIGAAGELQLLGGRNYAAATALSVGGRLELGGGALSAAGGLSVAVGGTLTGFGTVASKVVVAGTVFASGGTLALNGGMSGAGTVSIAKGATVVLPGGSYDTGFGGEGVLRGTSGALVLTGPLSGGLIVQAASGATIDLGTAGGSTLIFGGTGASIAFANGAGFTGIIAGFQTSDVLQVKDVLASAAVATPSGADSVLTLATANGSVTLKLAGDYSGKSFSVAPDGGGGTDITVAGVSFVPASGNWSSPTISWSFATRNDLGVFAQFSSFVDPVAQAGLAALWRAAFARWSAVSGLNFVETADTPGQTGQADIRVGWGNFGNPPAGEIGNAFSSVVTATKKFVPGTIVRLQDPAITPLSDSGGTLLYQNTASSAYQVMLHEIGHALGLDHAAAGTDPAAVMGPSAGPANRDLDISDIAGIRAVYGAIAAPVATSIAIGALSATRPEGTGGTTAFTFTVIRSGNIAAVHSASWSVTGTGASPAGAADFPGNAFPSGTVAFAAGQTNQTVTVNVSADTLVEPNETFTITLANPQGGAAITTASATGTVQNDDTSLAIAAAASSSPEGTGTDASLTFTITRSGDTSRVHTAAWSVAGSGAAPANAADFASGILPSGSLTFAIGEASKTITVAPRGDNVPELDEGFTVALTSTTPGTVVTASTAAGTILNDDAVTAASIAISGTGNSKPEGSAGSTAYSFTVTRSGDLSGVHTVQWAAAGASGSGTSPANAADFIGAVLPAGTIVFAAAEASKMLTVLVAADHLVELNERFAVTLSAPSTGAVLTTASAPALSTNDDINIAIAGTKAPQLEGNSGTQTYTYTITRSGIATGTNSVAWSAAGAGPSPANAEDFAGGILPSGSVTFAPGETSKVISIATVADTAIEATEYFRVTLGAPTNGATLGASATGSTIFADDASIVLSPAVISQAEGTGGTTAYTFTVNRTGGDAISQSVGWTVTALAGPGTQPASADDFVGGAFPSGVLVIGNGEASRTITVAVVADASGELNERFALNISALSPGLTVVSGSAQGVIQNDDTSLAVVATSASQTEGNSGTRTYSFAIQRSGNTSISSSVNWLVQGDSPNPTSAADFAGGIAPSGSVTFAPGETSKTITVAIAGDIAVEPDETFQVALINPSAGTEITVFVARATILADDTSLSIAPLSAAKPEGTGAPGSTTPYTFTVTRNGGTAGVHTVAWAATGANGSGTVPASAADFAGGIAPSGSVSFAAGETSKTVTVNIAADVIGELNERFAVTLSGASAGASIANPVAEGVIRNDDSSFAVIATTANQTEGNSGSKAYAFTIQRSGLTSAAQNVSWSVAGSGANPAGAADFAGGILAGGTLSFLAGQTSQTITVLVAGDTLVEPNEDFQVILANPTGGAALGVASATRSILGDDATLSIAAASANKPEGTGGSTGYTFTVSRAGGTAIAHSTGWSVAGIAGSGTAPASAADFAGGVFPAGTVNFAAGEVSRTITLGVAADTLAEVNERFAVTLAGPSVGASLGTAVAQGIILDDDTIYSTAADEDLVGSADADVFYLGGGLDTVAGLGGVDSFRFQPSAIGAAASHATSMEDFSRAAGERLDLSRIDAIAATLANDAFSFIGTAAFGNVAGQLRWTDTGGELVVEGDVSGDGVADLTILLDAEAPVDANWFVL